MSEQVKASPAKAKGEKKKAASKKPAAHPKYSEMIATAIGTLKERSGSSRQAILKYIQANFKVSESAATHVKSALRRGVSGGLLKQVKGAGASGSFKLADKLKVVNKTKKPAAKKAKKPAAKKPAAKKATPKKKKAAKKTPKKAVKKPAAKKPAAKKPVAKKAKKAAPKKKAPAAKK